MPSRWLIAADDLTGAADCAIAFTKSGIAAAVIWADGASNAPVVSLNIESRALSPTDAADAHRRALERLWTPETQLYKKVDSTIRGQPVAELVASIAYLKEKGAGAFAIISPAFPATGRTTENGAVRVQGEALEATPLWARDHTYDTAHLPTICEQAGLKTALANLTIVRLGAEALGHAIDEAQRAGCAALVCDAVTEADLDIIAAATLPRAQKLFWVGSGGLAASLARLEGVGSSPRAVTLPAPSGGVLIAVGSLAEASRASARQLARSGKVRHVLIAPETILSPDRTTLETTAADIRTRLANGEDVLVEIALTETPDLSLGTRLMDNLAAALVPIAGVISGLIATGGDTAVALLSHFGVNGIELLEEVESGIPLGLSIGRTRTLVVTKAGAFGGETTLDHCLDRIHAARA